MNLYNQLYCLATTPTGRNNKVGWYKTHNSHDILAKRLHPSVLLIGELNRCRPKQISDGMEKAV